MKIETEDLTQIITPEQETLLVRDITEKYDRYDDLRASQITDNRIMRDTIYNTDIPKLNGWDNKISLPDICCHMYCTECLSMMGVFAKYYFSI